jgi:hypothetical protein
MQNTNQQPPAKYKGILSALSNGSQNLIDIPNVHRGGKLTKVGGKVLMEMKEAGLIDYNGLIFWLTDAGYDVYDNWNKS